MSREIDERVAREVMGWTRMTEGELYGEAFPEVYPTATNWGFDESRACAWWIDPSRPGEYKAKYESTRMAEDDCDPEFPRFAPSTSIADAWLVVEKMNADRVFVCIQNDQDGNWQVFVGANRAPVESRSAPEAICMAALAFTSGERLVVPDSVTGEPTR